MRMTRVAIGQWSVVSSGKTSLRSIRCFPVKKFAFPRSISSYFDLFRLIRGPNFELFRGISTYFWVFRAISTYFEVKNFPLQPQMNADLKSPLHSGLLPKWAKEGS